MCDHLYLAIDFWGVVLGFISHGYTQGTHWIAIESEHHWVDACVCVNFNLHASIYIYMSCGPAVGIHVHGSRITQFGFKLVGADLWVAPIGYGGSL